MSTLTPTKALAYTSSIGEFIILNFFRKRFDNSLHNKNQHLSYKTDLVQTPVIHHFCTKYGRTSL